jgi:L-iditol 2-dehydrogenase
VLALRLHPDRRLRLHDEPVPDPGPDDALVRVTAVGLCGSDRHWLVDGGIGDATLDAPLVLGHEAVGVAMSGALRGRRVFIEPAVACGRCEPCQSGLAHLCREMRFAGHGRTDGALRDYVAWPEASLFPLPDGIADGEAALIEPLAVAIHGVDLGHLRAGQTVAVIGCGPIGLLVVALARLAGAVAIVAADPLVHRREAAIALGATRVIAAAGTSEDEMAVVAASGGRGFDVVFEASGEASAVDCAIAAARPGARVVLLGIPPDDRTTFRASVARRKGLTLLLSRRSTADTVERAIALAAGGSIELGRLVTLRVPLDDGERAFDALVRRDGIKVIVEPTASAVRADG